MGLSMHDREVLADIERHLTASDPRLAARLSRSIGSPFGRTAARVAPWRHPVGTLYCLATILSVVLLLLAATMGEPMLLAAAVVAAGTACAALVTGRLRANG